jgi:acetyl esterase
MRPRMPFALRVFLFIVNLKKPDTSIPLDKTRKFVNWFLGMMDRRMGIRTPVFHSITGKSFQSSEGHEIKLKIFTPVKTTEALPVWVYFHGGGFAHGGYDLRPNFSKAIASKANCIVVSVSYRLSPEHPFPAGLNDCYEAVLWVSKNAGEFGGDVNRIAVGGESAGGNLAATVSLLVRDKGGPKLLYQSLLYPATDGTRQHPSLEENATGYMLTRALVEQYAAAYMPDEKSKADPYSSPLQLDLKNLPPALVITCGYDPIRDEGDLYAEKLKASGVPVLHKRYDNMIHDFVLAMPRFLPEAREATELIASELRRAFN